jgi:dynactin complex subunit
VGARVEVAYGRGKKQAKVKFVGTTHIGPGTYIGVELSSAPTAATSDPAVRLHNGTFEGREYFKCRAGRGQLVLAKAATFRNFCVSEVCGK